MSVPGSWSFSRSWPHDDVRVGAIDNLFARFDKHLSRSGYLAKGGQIVDATIIRKHPNSHAVSARADENQPVYGGEVRFEVDPLA
ncbi:protein of unknown function (plasmid) [Shinella sp. WSC3-e]|nr:protein of unknown function [Shinella sp. WSC3-e]